MRRALDSRTRTAMRSNRGPWTPRPAVRRPAGQAASLIAIGVLTVLTTPNCTRGPVFMPAQRQDHPTELCQEPIHQDRHDNGFSIPEAAADLPMRIRQATARLIGR